MNVVDFPMVDNANGLLIRANQQAVLVLLR